MPFASPPHTGALVQGPRSRREPPGTLSLCLLSRGPQGRLSSSLTPSNLVLLPSPLPSLPTLFLLGDKQT